MVIARFKRKWPRLIKAVERGLGKKFKEKPSFKLYRGSPSQELWTEGGHVTKARILLNKRTVRDQEKLATLTALHELRENLLSQHGVSETRAHKTAMKREKLDRERLGLNKSYGWLARENRTRRGQIKEGKT